MNKYSKCHESRSSPASLPQIALFVRLLEREATTNWQFPRIVLPDLRQSWYRWQAGKWGAWLRWTPQWASPVWGGRCHSPACCVHNLGACTLAPRLKTAKRVSCPGTETVGVNAYDKRCRSVFGKVMYQHSSSPPPTDHLCFLPLLPTSPPSLLSSFLPAFYHSFFFSISLTFLLPIPSSYVPFIHPLPPSLLPSFLPSFFSSFTSSVLYFLLSLHLFPSSILW